MKEPPNIKAIDKIFGVRGKSVFFAYGDTIFNPGGHKIPQHLIKHEEVHSRQQNGDPETWWERYLVDQEFRFQQEFEAHVAECVAFAQELGDNRNARRQSFKVTGHRLANNALYKWNPPLNSTKMANELRLVVESQS